VTDEQPDLVARQAARLRWFMRFELLRELKVQRIAFNGQHCVTPLLYRRGDEPLCSNRPRRLALPTDLRGWRYRIGSRQVREVNAWLGGAMHVGVHVAWIDDEDPHTAPFQLCRQNSRQCSSAALLAP